MATEEEAAVEVAVMGVAVEDMELDQVDMEMVAQVEVMVTEAVGIGLI